MAYRHPSLLLENDIDDDIDDAFDLTADTSSESIIVPTVRRTPTRTREMCDEIDKCRLVGRVNPNIVRTWEQLKSALNVGGGSGGGGGGGSCGASSSSAEDKQSFTLFCRQPYKEFSENFPVQRLLRGIGTESEFSADFFDSIDDNSMTALEAALEEFSAAGEGMAEDDCDSLAADPSKIISCWTRNDGE